jgi:hypothetical protein
MKMKSRYKIIPLEKKSIIQITTYKTGDSTHMSEGDKIATREDTYRWGYAVVEANKKDLPKDGEIIVSDYELIENDYQDGVAVFWDCSDNVTEEELEVIENAYNEDGDDGLTKLGWHYFDSEDKILGPFKIEKQKQK